MSLKVSAHPVLARQHIGSDAMLLAGSGERHRGHVPSGHVDAEPERGSEPGLPVAEGPTFDEGPAFDENQPLEPDARGAETIPFEDLYDEHFAFVWRTLRMLGVADDALEDAAQDAFAVVSRQLATFGGRSSVRTWVFAIVQRTAANYRRKHRRKVKPLVPLLDGVVSAEPTPLAHAEALEAAHLIERYCETLEPDRRALFVLALLEDVPAPEIARALDIPVNTVYSRVRSLRAGLERALLRGEEVPDERA